MRCNQQVMRTIRVSGAGVGATPILESLQSGEQFGGCGDESGVGLMVFLMVAVHMANGGDVDVLRAADAVSVPVFISVVGVFEFLSCPRSSRVLCVHFSRFSVVGVVFIC
jgi:hypothetical protein